jgi:phage/plasmid-like protein (TIGR03299 family)
MTRENLKWLNRNILIGYTEQRGTAWHYVKSLQDDEPNHYVGAVPVEDVLRRIFNWDALKLPVYYPLHTTGEGDSGPEKPIDQVVRAPGQFDIVRSDTRLRFKSCGRDYQIHQYSEWLLKTLANLIDDELNIGSAGILQGGGSGFVTLELPESVEVLTDFQVRPHLLAATSHNGRYATTYKTVATFVVCDNTLAIALNEETPQFKVRHSKRSTIRLQSVRDALNLVHAVTDSAKGLVLELSELQVSDSEWNRLVKELAPVPELGASSSEKQKREAAKARVKQDELNNLYNSDYRVAPWKGTGLGVFQAFSTHAHHVAGGNASRGERNRANAIGGATQRHDQRVLAALGIRGGR